MTKELETIYCVQCLSLQPREAAELIFRTGFYKVKVPLGRCKKCAADPSIEQPSSQERPTAESRLPGKAKLA